MSLKAFHLFFIAVSTLTSLGFGIWAVQHYRSTGSVGTLLMGIGAFVAGFLLVVYSNWFIRKMKNVSFL